MNWNRRYSMEQRDFEKAMGDSMITPFNGPKDFIDHIYQHHPSMVDKFVQGTDASPLLLQSVHDALHKEAPDLFPHYHGDPSDFSSHSCPRLHILDRMRINRESGIDPDYPHCDTCKKWGGCDCDDCMMENE